jgi:hypothetical protein
VPYLPTRLPRVMALAASAAFAVLLFAGSAHAGGYYQPSYRSYAPNYAYRGYPAYNGYGYYRNGHNEIRELQRLFPSTNWPPSMRYYSQ